MTAYKVVVDKGECPTCHEGALWTVEGPEGICIGELFEDEESAEEASTMLNEAHRAGQEAMRDKASERIEYLVAMGIRPDLIGEQVRALPIA